MMQRNKNKFSKKEINDMFKKALFYECKVHLTRLSTENNKSNKNKFSKKEINDMFKKALFYECKVHLTRLSTGNNKSDIPVLNCNKSQVIDAVEPLIVTSQPLTSSYKPHFSSLQEKTSKVIPTKKCIVVTPTTISNSPLVQVKSSMSETATLTQSTATCQLTNQNKKSVANNFKIIKICNTIVIDNKRYRLVKDSSGQFRAVFMPTISNSPSIQVTASPSETGTITQSTTTCQLTNQNKKSVAKNFAIVKMCNTIVIDNKRYRLVKDSSGQLRAVFMPTISNSPSIQVTASPSETGTITTCQSVNEPSGQMRAVVNGTLISVISRPTVFIRCDSKFRRCNNSATITCICRKVNYCSDTCRKSNWALHYADCD